MFVTIVNREIVTRISIKRWLIRYNNEERGDKYVNYPSVFDETINAAKFLALYDLNLPSIMYSQKHERANCVGTIFFLSLFVSVNQFQKRRNDRYEIAIRSLRDLRLQKVFSGISRKTQTFTTIVQTHEITINTWIINLFFCFLCIFYFHIKRTRLHWMLHLFPNKCKALRFLLVHVPICVCRLQNQQPMFILCSVRILEGRCNRL